MKVDKRRKYYAVVDTETTEKRRVVDFAVAIVDKKGTVYNQCAVLVNGVYGKEKLFYNKETGFFGIKNLKKREANYENMVRSGQRMLATVPAINRWLVLAEKTFSPDWTAYNLNFDMGVCVNTGIILDQMKKTFCLWFAAAEIFSQRKSYRAFCLEHKYFSPKMNMRTNAEVMAHYVCGNDLPEPHTALEDVLEYEVPILVGLLAQKKRWTNVPYSWRNYQLKDMVEPLGTQG